MTEMTRSSEAAADHERVASLEARVDELLSAVAVLTTQVAELQHAGAAPRVRPVVGPERLPGTDPETSPVPAPVVAADGAVDDESAGIGRRRLLLGGGAAAAAATAAVLATSATPAAADNGGALIMGVDTNTSTAATTWTPTTTAEAGPALWINQQGSGQGLRVWSFDGEAILAYAGAGQGIQGQSDTGHGVVGFALASGQGVFGSSVSGVGVYGVSSSDVGVFGEAPIGVQAKSPKVNLRLISPGDRTAPTGDATAHARGDFVLDGAGDVWVCVAAGTPGTWRKLTGPSAAGSFHLLANPVRIYDSRPGTTPAVGSKTKLTGNTARTLSVQANSSGVPVGATAVAVTLLLVNASSAGGNLTIWAGGAPRPSANAMVWGGSAGRFASTAITRVSATGQLNVAASASTDLALDVVGYYR